MLKIIEKTAEKISDFIDVAYSSDWLHYFFIALIILALILLFFGSHVRF